MDPTTKRNLAQDKYMYVKKLLGREKKILLILHYDAILTNLYFYYVLSYYIYDIYKSYVSWTIHILKS